MHMHDVLCTSIRSIESKQMVTTASCTVLAQVLRRRLRQRVLCVSAASEVSSLSVQRLMWTLCLSPAQLMVVSAECSAL
eukprot:1040383-Prorocentrum_minimum.AAC.3